MIVPWKSTLVGVILVLLTALSGSLAASADDWVEVKSPHFRVISDQGGRNAKRVALDLERIHRLYETVLPDAVSDPSQPVLAVVVEDGDGLVEWLPQYDAGQRPGGVFLSRRSGHYMVIRLDVGREIVYHEYLHLLTRLNVGKIPIWLNEGFAEFYSATEFVGSKARFGGINQDAISYLNRRSLIPFEELVGRVTNPHDDGNWIDIRVFYAQAWALTHYLMLGNEELASAGAIGRYMNLVQQGADQVEAFVEVVGPLDEVREDLRRYLRRLRLSVFEQELGDDLNDDGFVERDLPPHEMLAEQAVVLAGSGFVTEAADLVAEARAHDPESPAVLTAAGLVALESRDDTTAAAAFSAAIAAGATNYLPFYLSTTTSPSQETEPGLELPERLGRLRMAVAFNPRFTPAYQELVRLLLNDGQLDQAFDVARRAAEIDARDAYSWRLMGQAALQSNKFEAARLAGARGLEESRDDRGRTMMESFLADVDRYEERARRFEERRAESERRGVSSSEVSPIAAGRGGTAPRVVDARSSLPATERAGGDSDERQVTMSGTWTELRCLDIPAVDFVIQSHRPPTTLVITAAGSAPIEIMGPSGEVQERVGCGSVGREVEVDFTIRRIAAGTVYGDMTELRFP